MLFIPCLDVSSPYIIRSKHIYDEFVCCDDGRCSSTVQWMTTANFSSTECSNEDVPDCARVTGIIIYKWAELGKQLSCKSRSDVCEDTVWIATSGKCQFHCTCFTSVWCTIGNCLLGVHHMHSICHHRK